jgi:hypothetical protein
MAAGRPRRFLPPCAMTGSMRPACSTAPSTANASAPMSNSSSRRPSSRAMSLSSRLPQGKGGATGHPSRRGAPHVPAQILARPQPDRAGVRQVQDFAAKGRSPNIRRCRERKRSHPRSIPTRRMRRLCQERRIRVNPNAEGSSGANLTLGTRRFGPVRQSGIDAEPKLRRCKNQADRVETRPERIPESGGARLESGWRTFLASNAGSCCYCLEAVDDYVGSDNPVRFIDAFVEGSTSRRRVSGGSRRKRRGVRATRRATC